MRSTMYKSYTAIKGITQLDIIFKLRITMQYIKKLNISTILLVLVTARLLLFDAGIALALFGVGMISLYAYNLHLKSKEIKPLDEEVRKELANIKNTISGIAVKTGVRSAPTENQRYF